MQSVLQVLKVLLVLNFAAQTYFLVDNIDTLRWIVCCHSKITPETALAEIRKLSEVSLAAGFFPNVGGALSLFLFAYLHWLRGALQENEMVRATVARLRKDQELTV